MSGSGTATTATAKWREKLNRPPEGEPWIWMTHEMLSSPAWRAMPLRARRVVERILIEHMGNAGKNNGALKCTYANFEAHGVGKNKVRDAILHAVHLGFIDITTTGRLAYGGAKLPSEYALTWLPIGDAKATNRWRMSKAEVTAALVAVVGELEDNKQAWTKQRRRTDSEISRAA